MLERSSTARYANHLWRLRDGHLSRLHPSVPKQTKESLRQAPLLGTHLFPEETVAVAARNLRGDVQHLNLSNSLRFFTASKKQSTGNKASSQPPKAKPQVQQPVNQAAGRGRGGQASRGKPNKASRGRGRGGQKQKHSWLLPPSTVRVSEPPLQASDFGPISASNRGQAVRLFGGMDQNRSKQMGSENPIGGVQPPLLQSASSHFSRLSGLLPESGEEEGPSRCSEGDGDERGDRSRKDSFSGLLQSALFSAESPGDMEADNRPLGSEHPHPVSVLQDGDQWVTSQSPSKRAMAHHSGFERRLLSHPHSPLLQAVPPVLPRGRGLAIPSSSFRVKHCTTSVYNGHGTCCGLRPSQWGQPPRLSRRLAVKPHIGGASQTANPMVIGPLRTPRLGGKRGEVESDSFTGGHLLGNFARYQSRPRLPLREEDRTMALHLGGFPSGAGPACPALVTTFGAPSFPREASSLRPVAYPTHSVPTSLRMVSSQRSSSDPGQPGSRDPGFHSLVENSFESPQRNPTRIPSDRSFPLHRLKCCGLGCSHGQKDRLREVVRGHERAAHQCAGTECDLAWSPSLRGYSPRLQCCHYVRQCLCHCLSEKSGGHSVSTDVPHGHRYLRMGRKTVHNTDTQTSPWASQCVSRSSEPQRSDSENRMESESSRSTACIPSLGQSTCGSVCTQVQHQTSNLHVSDSRTGGLEGRQSSPIVGRSVRLRVPTNGSDQTLNS